MKFILTKEDNQCKAKSSDRHQSEIVFHDPLTFVAAW